MFKKIVPLQQSLHQSKKIKNTHSLDFAANFHVASIMVHEFVRAAAIYPIVFIEDKELDQFRPVVLLGLQANQNLFVDAEGHWQASYIPAIVRRYPFVLAKAEQQEQFMVCIDEESEMINEEEGIALFNEDGSPAEILENVKRYLSELQQMELITTSFCKFLKENNLFVPMNMRVRKGDGIQQVAGSYVINEERLQHLSDSRFLEMRENRFLPAIYAHLTSLAQIERLIRMAGEGDAPVVEEGVERIWEQGGAGNEVH